MAGELESLLSGFFEDFKSGVSEIQTLKLNCEAEIKKREALQLAIESLKQENQRLSRLYAESLNNLVDQVEHRTTCHSLKKRIKEDEEERKVSMELMKQEYTRKIEDSEARIRSLQIEKETAEATVNHLHRDLEAHKSHIQHLATRLNQLNLTVESRYELEIQELKNHIAAEQEEKNELNKRLQHLEKELLICRSKPVNKPRILTSSLLQRNEIRVLKRKRDSEGNK